MPRFSWCNSVLYQYQDLFSFYLYLFIWHLIFNIFGLESWSDSLTKVLRESSAASLICFLLYRRSARDTFEGKYFLKISNWMYLYFEMYKEWNWSSICMTNVKQQVVAVWTWKVHENKFLLLLFSKIFPFFEFFTYNFPENTNK